jgi:TrwC relaxase
VGLASRPFPATHLNSSPPFTAPLCLTPFLPVPSKLPLHQYFSRHPILTATTKIRLAHGTKVQYWVSLQAVSRPKPIPLQAVSLSRVVRWSLVLTISRLSRWSVNCYSDTATRAQAAAMDRQAAGGGLGEYYSERDTRVPTWLVAGNKSAVGDLVGLAGGALEGGFVDTEVAGRWLDDGIAPNGAAGRAFVKESVHGFDLTFAAPKSVSLLRAHAARTPRRRDGAPNRLRRLFRPAGTTHGLA